MDPLSITASVVSLAAVVRETVKLVQGIKDGGDDRIRVATEVKSLLIVLRSVEGFCETCDEDADTSWISALRSISAEGGILECARSELQKLNEILRPKSGRHKLIQSVKWPLLDKASAGKILQHVLRLKESMTSVLEQANTSMTRTILLDTKDLHDALQTDNMNAVLEWLSPLNMLAKQGSLTEICGKGSGRWMIDLPLFNFWKQSTKEILWCPGIPGAGKTVMSSIVAKDLQDTSKNENVGIFMLYISFNDPATQSVENLLAALLKQTIQVTKTLPPGIQELYQKHATNQTLPERVELVSQIAFAFANFSKIYVVVDALDEILQENARLDLVQTLWDLEGDTNLFITSRLLPNIQQHFSTTSHMCDICESPSMKTYHRCLDCPDWDACTNCFSSNQIMCLPGHSHMKQFHVYCIEISAKLEDLESYIRGRIKSSCSLESITTKKAGLQGEIVDTVTRLAEERFLLAKFHMDTLASLHRPSQVSKALKDLPSRIDETYDQAMQRINAAEQNREEAKVLLRWVIHSYRPLHIREIEHATSIYPDQEEFDPDDIISADVLCSWCAGMVVIEAGFLRLVHYTAKDYFLTEGAHWFSDGPTLLGQACLTYLSLNSSSTIIAPSKDEITTHWGQAAGEAATFFEHAQDFPLLGYASMFWSAHVVKSKDEDLQHMASDFLCQSKNVTTLAMVYRCLGCGNASTYEHRYTGNDLFDGASALHIASFWGLETIVNHLLQDERNDVDTTDKAGLTPLMYASLEGCASVVKILLEAGAQANLECVAGSSALHRAIFHGHKDVVETLIHCKGIDLTSPESKTGFSPLISAIFQQKCDIVARLLAVNDLPSDEDCPSLAWAAYTGGSEVVELLLHHSKDQLNSQDRLGRTPLLNAARKDNNSEVIKMLLDAGADREIPDINGNTPIMESIKHGFTENVRVLVKDTSTKLDQFRGSLLHIAAQNDDHGVLRIILEHSDDLDIDAKDGEGRTALHCAALQDFPLIAMILLEFGADSTIRDATGHSPIELASQNFHIITYRVLLEADGYIAGELRTSLSRVEMHIFEASSPKEDLEQVARETESRAESEPLVGVQNKASFRDVLTISVDCELQFDLDQELDYFFQTRSALQHAIENGDPIIAQTLMDADVDLNNYEEQGDGPQHRLPLEMKVPKGLIRITEILVKHVNRSRTKCDTPSNSSATTLVNDDGEWRVALFLVTFLAT